MINSSNLRVFSVEIKCCFSPLKFPEHQNSTFQYPEKFHQSNDLKINETGDQHLCDLVFYTLNKSNGMNIN